MIDAHCHIARGESQHFICEPFVADAVQEGDIIFYGTHPWDYMNWDGGSRLRGVLQQNPLAGVGEIGLDRLRDKAIPEAMREAFIGQLRIAAEFHRPVVLHGAKCWGEVVKACGEYAGEIPAFLFHGFSRSGGLLPEIKRIGGYVSIGSAILNDHAVNYRRLVKEIPEEMLLIESDATETNKSELPHICEIMTKVAEIRGVATRDLNEVIAANAKKFISFT